MFIYSNLGIFFLFVTSHFIYFYIAEAERV